MNRYITTQISRLRTKKGHPDQFFRLAFFLIINSTTFRLSAIHHVFPLWYRNMKLSQIKSISSKTTKIAKKIITAEDSPYTQLPFNFPMKYKRVYIPKANQKELRPLGVPQPQ